MSCAKNTFETGGNFGSDCIYFLPRGSQDVLPRMSHGNRGRVVLPVVVVLLTSALWKPRQGIWEMVSWWVEPFTPKRLVIPKPHEIWVWNSNGWNFKNIQEWYLGSTYTYHAHILLGRLFFFWRWFMGIIWYWNTKPRAHPGLNLCVGACFFHFQAVIVSLLPALFQGWFTTKTCFFFTSPNLKENTHHTKTRVKRYEPLVMATNALFLRGTLGWVGWPDMNHLNHHLPIILAMLGIHLTIAMSHLLRTSSGSWWKLSSHDVLWQGVTRGPSRQWGMTGQLVAGGVFFLAKLMGNRWK